MNIDLEIVHEWFYSHDTDWQNDTEIDYINSKSSLDLEVWAYNKYNN